MFDPAERQYLADARVARLATAGADARPHVVPVCFALTADGIVTPIDEKPKSVGPTALRRVRDGDANPPVALVADHYVEDWTGLGWVQVRGTAAVVGPEASGHRVAIAALTEKYDQYADHDLATRPVIRIEPGTVRSWGALEAGPSGPHEGSTR